MIVFWKSIPLHFYIIELSNYENDKVFFYNLYRYFLLFVL